ncbi:MAG: DUF362 domain-containing protein [Spirochaetaceae bacterium]|nr:DUF362 domain-containing protein [Spirochaetaceae bacterium]
MQTFNKTMSTSVAVQKCDEYEFSSVYQCVKKLLELVPPPDVKGKTVLLKPNILYPKKVEDAVCTHPVVVGACVKAFVELGAKEVLVGESPAIANSTNAAKSIGLYDIVEQNGGKWADFNGSLIVPCPEGKIVKQFSFATAFEKADIVVSLSKLKTHQFMSYTGAMKNLFGLMVGLDKAQSHYRFPKKEDFGAFLTDLNICAKPCYAVMDAIVGMEGPGGPGSGDPVKLGFLASSDNILALDWFCAEIVGYNPYEVVNLKDALERKIWLENPEQIKVLGESIDEIREQTRNFKIVKEPSQTLGKMLPGWLDFLATKILTRNVHFKQSKCLKCQRCKQICPAQIIKMTGKNGTAQLSDATKCLHCFCCHEICPADAIKLRRFF